MRQLQGPRAVTNVVGDAVAQGDAPLPQPPVSRVEIGGSQVLLRNALRPPDELAQVRKREADRSLELHLPLKCVCLAPFHGGPLPARTRNHAALGSGPARRALKVGPYPKVDGTNGVVSTNGVVNGIRSTQHDRRGRCNFPSQGLTRTCVGKSRGHGSAPCLAARPCSLRCGIRGAPALDRCGRLRCRLVGWVRPRTR